MRAHILGDISVDDFLTHYWQKRPLVIRGAFPDFEMPFTAQELAGIACETDVPSRIIVERGLMPKPTPWQTKQSPFTDEDFTSLPDTHWTFLVNDLERYIPELGNLIEPFRFIPDWRIDDVMVSYAADQGSVGPHVDEYDVFLIQGEGSRRWKITTDDNYSNELIPDISLAILKDFKTDREWLLEKGDMLYLPPNMPHYGIAEGECFTFSIGFRSPRTVDLLQNWMESFSDENTPYTHELQKRYHDINRKIQDSSGEISHEDLHNLSQIMLEGIERQKDNISIFLGKHLTESRGDIPASDHHEDHPFDENYNYERESWLRFSYFEDKDDKDEVEDKKLHFFASGQHIELPLEKKAEIQELCENYYYTTELLQLIFTDEKSDSKLRLLFNTLATEGGLFATSA